MEKQVAENASIVVAVMIVTRFTLSSRWLAFIKDIAVEARSNRIMLCSIVVGMSIFLCFSLSKKQSMHVTDAIKNCAVPLSEKEMKFVDSRQKISSMLLAAMAPRKWFLYLMRPVILVANCLLD